MRTLLSSELVSVYGGSHKCHAPRPCGSKGKGSKGKGSKGKGSKGKGSRGKGSRGKGSRGRCR